ncbi:MAG: hypothetical protein DI624_04110 [Brevundimonas sp.]|nr:MAG: hypothetical protein DI624_04110 [Brevundimonas sp.]
MIGHGLREPGLDQSLRVRISHGSCLRSVDDQRKSKVYAAADDLRSERLHNVDMSASYPNHIREWREFRHMTQDELADAVGCSKASIGHWENGVREVAPKWLYPIAKVLNTSPGYLLDHDPNNLPTAVLDIWADIPSEDQPKALEMLRVFKRTGTEG